MDVFNMLQDGGWIMLPLFICSVIALTIIVERMWYLRRNNVIAAPIIQLLDEYRGEDHVASALSVCRQETGVFAQLITSVIETREMDHAQSIESMHAVGRTKVSHLERGLTILEIVAAISPLVGLLGTVLGMVDVFNAITAQGLGDPQILSDGISKALITTVAGLSVAIPALAFHSIFSKRVDEFATEMQDRATAFILRLQKLQEDRA